MSGETFSKKKVLITGASGFIGSFLVEEAIAQGHIVYAGVRPGSSKQFLQDSSIRFFNTPLSSKELLEMNFRHFNQKEGGFDYIIHNAGITRARSKEEFDKVNHQYTRHLAEALLAAGRPPEKFILISSLAAGGPGSPEGLSSIQMGDADHPISGYAKSKLNAELFIRSQMQIHPIVVRPTAVFGPRDRDFLTYFRLVSRGFAPKLGFQSQRLSFVYVKDLASAVCRLLAWGEAGQSYIVSDGNSYSEKDMPAQVRKALGKASVGITVPLAPVRAAVFCLDNIYSLFGRMPFLHSEKLREITSPNWACDSTALWKLIKSKPRYDLESGIKETALWYKHNGWLN